MGDLPSNEPLERPSCDVARFAEADDEEKEELLDHSCCWVGVDGVIHVSGEPVDEAEPIEEGDEHEVGIEDAESDLEEEDVVVPGDLSNPESGVLSVVVVLLSHALTVPDPETVSELGDVDDD